MSKRSLSAFAAAAVVAGALHAPLLANPFEKFAEATSYSQKGDWNKAAETWAELVAENPYHGAAWQRYGFALHQLARYDEARAAFEKAIELGHRPVTAAYNIACGYALLGEPDEALDWLEQAWDAGFTEQDTVEHDSDLDSIRGLARFNEITGLVPPENLSRDARWRYDLDFLQTRMEQVHFDLYGVVSEAEFTRAVEDLKAKVPMLADHEIAVGIQRLASMAGDGHTNLRPPVEQLNVRRYPLRLHLFTDGLFVQTADREYAPAVGAKILEYGNLSAEDAWDRIAGIVSVDNAMGFKAGVPRYMVVPEILHALKIIDDPAEPLPMVVQTPGGEQVTVYVEPGPWGGWDDDLVMARDGAEAPVPLWLQQPDRKFWFEHLPERDMVWFQYNTVRDEDDETIEQFSERLFDFIDDNDVDYLVIDMRRNGGGNNFLNKPIVHGLISSERINRRGHLFVITGRFTFSAAMNGVADIEANTEAIFVGEPTGSKPNFVGETTMITLPCSGLQLSCSSLYWQRSHAFDHRTWIAPALIAEMSSEDYRTNRDPAMDAILGFIDE